MPPRILHVLDLQKQLTDDQITTLVHRFYERVRDEPLLGPVFAARIADDAWPAHLDKMVRFWSTILRGSNRYTGNPMIVHRDLPGVTAAHFARWLELFEDVAASFLDADVSASIVHRARRMGERLQAFGRRQNG